MIASVCRGGLLLVAVVLQIAPIATFRLQSLPNLSVRAIYKASPVNEPTKDIASEVFSIIDNFANGKLESQKFEETLTAKSKALSNEREEKLQSLRVASIVGAGGVGALLGLMVDIATDVEVDPLLPPVVGLTGLASGAAYIQYGGQDAAQLQGIVNAYIGAPILKLGDAIVAAVTSAVNEKKRAIKQKQESAIQFIKDIPTKIKMAVNRKVEEAQNSIKKSIDAKIAEILRTPINIQRKLLQRIDDTTNRVRSSIESAVEDITSTPRKFAQQVSESTSNTIDRIVRFPSELATSLTNTISAKSRQIRQSLDRIVDGALSVLSQATPTPASAPPESASPASAQKDKIVSPDLSIKKSVSQSTGSKTPRSTLSKQDSTEVARRVPQGITSTPPSAAKAPAFLSVFSTLPQLNKGSQAKVATAIELNSKVAAKSTASKPVTAISSEEEKKMNSSKASSSSSAWLSFVPKSTSSSLSAASPKTKEDQTSKREVSSSVKMSKNQPVFGNSYLGLFASKKDGVEKTYSDVPSTTPSLTSSRIVSAGAAKAVAKSMNPAPSKSPFSTKKTVNSASNSVDTVADEASPFSMSSIMARFQGGTKTAIETTPTTKVAKQTPDDPVVPKKNSAPSFSLGRKSADKSTSTTPQPSSGKLSANDKLKSTAVDLKPKLLSSSALKSLSNLKTSAGQISKIDSELRAYVDQRRTPEFFYLQLVDILKSKESAYELLPDLIGCLPRGDAKRDLNGYYQQKL